MKVFISSLITGMESLRGAAREAVEALGHEAIMAEDFSAAPTTPRKACLDAVRRSDAVVLILGERYGAVQASGISATHEEYREAQATRPVFSFVQGGVTFEPSQNDFLREVQGWDAGLFRREFSDALSLRQLITKALHQWELSRAAGAPNGDELLRRTLALIDQDQFSRRQQGPQLVLSVVGGPTQQVLRPSELEKPALAQGILKEALFGSDPLFDSTKGGSPSINDHTLTLRETGDEAFLSLSEDGSLVIGAHIRKSEAPHGLPTLVEEYVHQQLVAVLSFADWLLERIDQTERLTHLAIAAKISDASGIASWQTLAEEASRQNKAMGGFYMAGFKNHPPGAVHLSPPLRARAALRMERSPIAEDLLALLRRAWKQ